MNIYGLPAPLLKVYILTVCAHSLETFLRKTNQEIVT